MNASSPSTPSGFIPNVFWPGRTGRMIAPSLPTTTLLDRKAGLTKAEREMIVVATSAINHCHYCVIAHGAIPNIRAKQPLTDQIAINPQRRSHAAAARDARFAVKVAAR